jgi:hypothetical protein
MAEIAVRVIPRSRRDEIAGQRDGRVLSASRRHPSKAPRMLRRAAAFAGLFSSG